MKISEIQTVLNDSQNRLMMLACVVEQYEDNVVLQGVSVAIEDIFDDIAALNETLEESKAKLAEKKLLDKNETPAESFIV